MAARILRPTGPPRPPIAAEVGEARGVALGGDIDSHPEADAIIGVIRDGLSAIRQKDFHAWADTWVQAPYVRRIGTQGWDPAVLCPWTGLVVHDGWDDIGRFMTAMLGDESAVIFPHGTHCENWFLRVRGDTACVTFDQYLLDANGRHAPEVTGVNHEMRMLEKHSDGWKFNYMSFFHEHPRRVVDPVALVDEYAAISGMTRTAAERIGNSEALRVRNGRLRATDRDVDKRLSAAIRKSAHTTSWDSHVYVPVLVSTPWGSPDCVCWIAPLLDMQGTAVILLDDAPTSRRRLHNAIIVYRLSAAQARLAERIVDGHDLVSAAEQLGITVNTARTHLNRMFQKTGVRSQPALVAALLSVPAPLK
jgi:DNA-binding CsgD family transcriptional regulator